MRFADRAAAERFSFERDHAALASFGFHGVFNLVDAVGMETFWDIYCELDDLTTIRPDFWPILRSVLRNARKPARVVKLLQDRFLRR